MSKLNRDIIFYIFQDLIDFTNMNLNNNKKYRKSLFYCLLVNKLWCEIMIPILWSSPYKYICKKELFFNIIISHLSDNSIILLKYNHIIKPSFKKQKLSFNYIKFCKNLNDIHKVLPNDPILKKEIYKLFISECSIKCLSLNMIYYPIFQYPGANISLSNLYELYCNIREQNFYHELAQICRSIEKLYINLYDYDLSGIVELIEMQKQIKYLYIEGYCECQKIILALEKHVNSIIYLVTTEYTSFLHFLFPKLTNLQFIRICTGYNINNYEPIIKFEEYSMDVSYCKLQILELYKISLHIVINIIQNTNGNLWKIKIRLPSYEQAKEYNKTIYKYCPNIKYATVFLNRDETLEELENIFIKCQYLEAIDIDELIMEKYRDKFLDLLIELAPLTLYKIHIDRFRYFNKESLKLFFINWNCKGKKTLHLYHRFFEVHNFIKKYKIEGIIECNYYDDDFWNHEITWSDTV
ncbi:hypothetical protein C1646_750666 [Rhizophagus diaphanus]|nr:hypothetical protein C1646_750666 [Rhizophagus diaphanus] [Rhizophagus sp. MUCL 43196]